MNDCAEIIPEPLCICRQLYKLTRDRRKIQVGFVGVSKLDSIQRPLRIEFLMDGPLVVLYQGNEL